MSGILFLIGIGLAVIGRINVLNINAEGPQVRGAGVIMMLPLLSLVFLGFAVGMIAGGSQESLESWTGFIGLLDIPLMVVGAFMGYRMLQSATEEGGGASQGKVIDFNPLNNTRSRNQQQEDSPDPKRDDSQDTSTEDTSSKPPAQPRKSTNDHNPFAAFLGGNSNSSSSRPKSDFPSVMNTKEAAHYLDISETEVLNLIEEGKLTAAKNNYRFQISRSVLDEFIRARGDDS